jgi:hypothetical protein
LLLFAMVGAQKCVSFKASFTAGICSGNTVNGFACTNTDLKTSEQISAKFTSESNQWDLTSCQNSAQMYCRYVGVATNPDYCKTGGPSCKFFVSECRTDADCASGAERPTWCCSSNRKLISLQCASANSSLIDSYVKGTGCRDTNCLEWSPASSLRPVTSFLSAAALLAVAVSHFGRR